MTPFIQGTWANADPRRQFVEGAWMFYTLRGATPWSEEVADMEAEAERRFPGGVVPDRRTVHTLHTQKT